MANDFSWKRLSEVYPQCIGFDCNTCYRYAVVRWQDLKQRFSEELTLGEIALQLAKGAGINPCLHPTSCQARANEMPVETWATLQHAYKGNWRLQLECGRRHEGLKAAKSCAGLIELDVRSLYAAFGRDYPIDRLRLYCPGCLTRHINLIWTVPPDPPPAREVVSRLPDGRPVDLDEEAIAFNTRRAMRKAG